MNSGKSKSDSFGCIVILLLAAGGYGIYHYVTRPAENTPVNSRFARALAVQTGHVGSIDDASFNADGSLYLTLDSQSYGHSLALYMWDVDNDKHYAPIPVRHSHLLDIEFKGDAKSIRRQLATLHDTKTEKRARFSGDGRVACWPTLRELVIVSVDDGEVLHRIPEMHFVKDEEIRLNYSGDRLFVRRSLNHRLLVFDVTTGNQTTEVETPANYTYAASPLIDRARLLHS